jgi:hypothetical protein
MRPADLAHTVIVVQSTIKKAVKPQLSTIGLRPALAICNAPRTSAMLVPGRCSRQASPQEGFAGLSDPVRRRR